MKMAPKTIPRMATIKAMSAKGLGRLIDDMSRFPKILSLTKYPKTATANPIKHNTKMATASPY